MSAIEHIPGSNFPHLPSALPPREIAAATVHATGLEAREIDAHTLADAMTIIDSCFPIAADRDAARSTYERYLDGPRSYHSPYQNQQVSLIHYAVFYESGVPAGVVGLYRLGAEADRLHMGWFGVHPDFRKTNRPPGELSVSQRILQYTEEMARGLGAVQLAAFTEDAPSNRPAQSFYERNGFEIVDRFERLGEAERLYQKTLGA